MAKTLYDTSQSNDHFFREHASYFNRSLAPKCDVKTEVCVYYGVPYRHSVAGFNLNKKVQYHWMRGWEVERIESVWFRDAQTAGWIVLDTMTVTRARHDATLDGLHYSKQTCTEGNTRRNIPQCLFFGCSPMRWTGGVSFTLTLLLLEKLCADDNLGW